MNNSFFGGIRQQIVGLFVVLVAALTAASYALFQVYLFGDFRQLEIERGRKNALRVEKLVGYMTERFRRTVAVDWAQYDKAFEYATGVNGEFIERDLSWESAQLTGFSHFLVTNREGTVLASGEYVHTDQSVQALATTAQQEIIQNRKIREFIEQPIAGSFAGLIEVEGRPHFIAVAQILPTSGEGTPGGFLIFAKPADERTLGDLVEVSQLDVTFTRPTDPEISIYSGRFDLLNADKGYLHGSINILDLDQNPILRAHFSYPHDIISQGHKTKSAMLWAIVSFLLVGSLALWLAINRLLLRPLNAMAKVLSTVTPSELSAHRLDESRSDELGVLARVFNGLMNSLAASYDELKKAKDFAEAANQSKSSFIAKVSHELRTPIHSVTGMLRILLREERTSSKRNYIMMARNAAYGLLETINEILDFSKAEAGKLVVERIEFSLHDAVREAIQTVGPRIEEKGSLEAMVDIPQGIPSKVLGDPMRLRQVLVNLLGNATKFTKEGHIGLRANLLESDEQRILLELTVFDTGVGIPSDRLEHIFEPFGQADESVSRMFTGTGLGLTIVKQFIEAMGGSVRVESKLGAGSRFTLTIPFDLVDGAVPIVYRPLLSAPRVLLLGNVSAIVDNYAQRLEESGYSAETVSCEEPLEISRVAKSINQYGLIIVTSEAMKRSQIFDLVVNLRGRESVPVVSVLSPFEISARERLLALEVPFVVTRPTSLLDILGVVSGEIVTSAEAWQDAEDWSLLANRPLEVLVADDAQTNRIILTELLREVGHNVVCVENGVELVARVKDSLQGVEGVPKFDIVLTDIQMPLLDGLSATTQIRLIEKGLSVSDRLPIVAVTAHAMTDEISRMRSFGVDDVVTKPLDPLKLGQVINRLTGNQAEGVSVAKATNPAAEGLSDAKFAELGVRLWGRLAKGDSSLVELFGLSEDPSSPEDFQRVLDLADVIERSGNSVRRCLLIFRGFLECFREQLQKLRDAKQENNHKDLRFASHALKGLLLDIGARITAGLAGSIEQLSTKEDDEAFTLVGQLTKQVLLVSRLVGQIERFASGDGVPEEDEDIDRESDSNGALGQD